MFKVVNLKKYFSSNQTSFLFLMLILPVYHIWKSWLAFGVWDLSKNYSYIPGISFILTLSYHYIKGLNLNWKDRIPEIAFAIFIIWGLSLVAIERINNPNFMDEQNRDVFKFNFKIIFFYIAHFLAGYFFPKLKNYTAPLIIFWIVMNINTWFFTDYINFSIDTQRGVVKKYLGEYPQWGDSMALLSIWLIVLVRDLKLKLAITVISLFTLYIIGSRASFFIFAGTVPFIYLFLRNYKTLMLIAASATIFSILVKFNLIPLTRIGSALSPSSDKSTQARLATLFHGWEMITSSPKIFFLGDLNGQVREFKDLGAYIHGHLSLWRQFGIYPFLLFLFVGVKTAISSIELVKNNISTFADKNTNKILIISTTIYIFTEALFIRGYISPYIWICYGIICQQNTGEDNG